MKPERITLDPRRAIVSANRDAYPDLEVHPMHSICRYAEFSRRYEQQRIEGKRPNRQ